jgi:hypothetical protein
LNRSWITLAIILLVPIIEYDNWDIERQAIEDVCVQKYSNQEMPTEERMKMITDCSDFLNLLEGIPPKSDDNS